MVGDARQARRKVKKMRCSVISGCLTMIALCIAWSVTVCLGADEVTNVVHGLPEETTISSPQETPRELSQVTPTEIPPTYINDREKSAVDTRPPAPGVLIKSEADLSFGLVRVRPGIDGWVLVDPGGGYSTSTGVAFSSKNLPAPGLVRVMAPPESRLLFSIDFERNAADGNCAGADGVSLLAVSIGRGVHALTRSGSLWELKMPRSESELVDVLLGVGGELQFTSTEGGRSFFLPIHIECVSVEPDR